LVSAALEVPVGRWQADYEGVLYGKGELKRLFKTVK